ncbi:methionine ABC transporter ATP-binding protein MetN [Dyadobacter jiangsuensis]|uniref:D-methionine transport system ATP-binding protein n=1 Tax=Dyadobacter jiangsuensis TaxID=1591085 RepID=A0A2P8G9J2_9BACT|nr:methionine ABC transporter ATP-binding protein MetN [Dyadobacter jiangsuensis]PSL30555.1 D-methionine transport system ATP-binding protein [Dyadobacter jiangsuensis]
MIELKNVTKIFKQKDREVTALAGVSLKVERGKIFGVIGTSGAGKSTLIRCVNLLEKPTSGEVYIDGKNLTTLPDRELALERRQIGMIFQHFNLLSSRTVFENVAFPLELDRKPKHEVRERVTELLRLVGLEEKAGDYPASLSGGQKQRVAIARTLASSPKVLLCDEATSALDPGTTASILRLLKDINRRLHITILLITHEMNVVKSICHDVAVISQGKLVEKGPVNTVFSNPKTELARSFISASLHVEIPEHYRQRVTAINEGGMSPLLRLRLTGDTADQPLLSQAARLFEIDTKIISAQMDHVGDKNFGVVLVALSGRTGNYQKAIDFFIYHHIKVELLGYV